MGSYRIKQIPEDFHVVEIPTLTLDPSGPYTYFTLTKKGYTTIAACSAVARCLGVPLKALRFAGSKDKHAVTEQACSIKGIGEERLSKITIPHLSISILGRGPSPLRLGDIKQNNFTITIREIDQAPQPLHQFINYFGPQRFGRNNPSIGKLLLQRKFPDALSLISPSNPDLAPALHSFLTAHPRDYIGALRTIPKTTLMLYIHAYQALLWNETVHLLLHDSTSSPHPLLHPSISLIGFDIPATTPPVESILQSIMERENITPASFIFREIPELSSPGGVRQVFVEAADLLISTAFPNNLGPGNACCISFSLPSGSYATVFIEQLFSEKSFKFAEGEH